MPFVAGLSDADFVNDDATTSTSDIKEVLRKFLRKQVWRDLGKVVAVDLFVCNQDRFDWEDFDEATRRGVTWANRGNIMFVGANVIGLDAPTSPIEEATETRISTKSAREHRPASKSSGTPSRGRSSRWPARARFLVNSIAAWGEKRRVKERV